MALPQDTLASNLGRPIITIDFRYLLSYRKASFSYFVYCPPPWDN
jgi:hypothetical protein